MNYRKILLYEWGKLPITKKKIIARENIDFLLQNLQIWFGDFSEDISPGEIIKEKKERQSATEWFVEEVVFPCKRLFVREERLKEWFYKNYLEKDEEEWLLNDIRSSIKNGHAETGLWHPSFKVYKKEDVRIPALKSFLKKHNLNFSIKVEEKKEMPALPYNWGIVTTYYPVIKF